MALRSNASVDLYLDAVLQHAKLVVVAMIGGAGYWAYGVERWSSAPATARDAHPLPGDDAPHPELTG